MTEPISPKGISSVMDNALSVVDSALVVHPYYQTAHAQITEPTRFVAMSHYYRRQWLRQMGPVGTAILLELRGRCYNNPATGERRDVVIAAQRELAEAIGISVDTLQRQLGRPGREDDPKANIVLRLFVWTEERYERGGSGRVRQLENVYHVSMDDPVHPDDEERLKALVEEYGRQAQEAVLRKSEGRKQIIRAPERDSLTSHPPPEPQIAVLRGGSKKRTPPEPQFAVGGHRNLRQGLPQIAVLSEESLLFITKEFTKTTLNVREGSFDFVTLGEEQALFSDPTPARTDPPQSNLPQSNLSQTELPQTELPQTGLLQSAFDNGLDKSAAALVQELRDWGSERRHRQLLSVCDQHRLSHLTAEALRSTRDRLSRESKLGVLEKPGAYYQSVLIKLLEAHQVFVPRADEDDPSEVQRLVRESLNLVPKDADTAVEVAD
jgi:hypothetical protein